LVILLDLILLDLAALSAAGDLAFFYDYVVLYPVNNTLHID
jgi:hypothetical protein